MKKLLISMLFGLTILSNLLLGQSYQTLNSPLQQISTSNSTEGWIYFKDPQSINVSTVFQ